MGRSGAFARAVAVMVAVVLVVGVLQAARHEAPRRQVRTERGISEPTRLSPTSVAPDAPESSQLATGAASSAPGATSNAPTPSSEEAVSSGPQTFEAEQLNGGQQVAGADASGGAFARAVAVATGPLQVADGTYVLQARVRGPQDGRLDLTVDDAMTGSYRTQPAWTVVSAVVRMGPGRAVGLHSVDTAGGARDTPLDVDWLSLAPTAPATTVLGKQMIGPDGASYVPKGLNFPFLTGDLDSSGAVQITEPPVDDVYVWGADALRMQLNEEYWLADCPVVLSYDRATTYRAAVVDAVSRLTAKGVHVFLSLLATERGKATGYAVPTRPWLKEMADQRSPGFWTSVATTFASNPLVVFDLFNEPHDISADVWLHGGTVYYPSKTPAGLPATSSFAAVGMQKLYDTVRAAGATNLISVSGPRWATDPRVMLATPLDGYGIVVGAHSYSASSATWKPQLNPSIDAYNDPVLARFPFVLTEAGWRSPPDARYNRAAIDWAAGNGVGYLIYAFYFPGDYSVVQSWDDTFDVGGVRTKPPNASGRPVWNDFTATRTARGYAANNLPES